MVSIIIERRGGSETVIEASPELSLMEAMRDNGIEELLALCGGCCSCATCHVHVDPRLLDVLPTAQVDEDDLLDSSDHRNERSRLACQLVVTGHFEGMRITVAAED